MRTLSTEGLALPSSVPMFSKILHNVFIFDRFDDGTRSDIWSPPQDDFGAVVFVETGGGNTRRKLPNWCSKIKEVL
jgi:hypothetical protein